MVAASFLPDFGHFGFLEWYFFLQLLLLALAVGAFAFFLLVNQFRNPGRKSRRPS